MSKRPSIVFMGTPDFAVASLEAVHQAGYDIKAVVTVPDRQSGRGQKITFSPVKDYALKHDLPLLQPEKLRDEAFLEDLRNLNADLFIVVAFRMLPKVVWDMPKMGTFNLHASLLPDYRGAAPINWAVMNGETESGVTTFMLNERIDEGGILLQEKTPISPDDNAGTLHDRLMMIGKDLVLRTVEGLADGTLTPRPQPTVAQPKNAPKIFKDDCRIDWNKPGEDIVNFVRGLSPYPAAFMELEYPNGDVLPFKIFDVTFEKGTSNADFSIVTDQKKYLKIAVNGGFVVVNSLQMGGKRRNSIENFLIGNNVTNCKLVIKK
ncbi:MAG: methionyl-tRNA formyltransferase [Bacteroidales bacterium]|nr:methionyl-tRNA formyltransferase [Bacteroidales bacterium]